MSIHRIDPGTARTWCGIQLDGVPEVDSRAAWNKSAVGARQIRIAQSGTFQSGYNCANCARHERRQKRFSDAGS